MTAPVRGTQSLVGQMGWVMKRPQLSVLEICWRWLFGIPFLLLCWMQWQRIVEILPLYTSGFSAINTSNPWEAALQFAQVWMAYEPHVLAVLAWLAPASALVWVVISGLGRSIVLKRMDPSLRWRPLGVCVLQAAWLLLLAATFWAWFRSVQWVAATHVMAGGEPDLVGYFIWVIFLSLGFFTLWAVISWPAGIAPLLLVLEGRNPASALLESFRLGKDFTGKLMEVNLVMGIVRLMLIVLTMVFAAAPLPFADELSPSALHVVMAGSLVFYVVASDYFQVVRLKSFLEFWHTYRGEAAA